MLRNERKDVVHGNDIFDGHMASDPKWGNMGKEERKNQVLKLLAESGLALTPYVIFRNLKMRGATFERRTLSNYLNELIDEGRVQKISDSGDPLYQITPDGVESISEDS